MTTLAELETYLRSVGSRREEDQRAAALLKTLKAEAVTARDELLAKRIWCYQQILQVQSEYLLAFSKLKSGSHLDAWCAFERAEIALYFLEPHWPINEEAFRLQFIGQQTQQFQALFPYKLFISPELLIRQEECSICHKLIRIREPCGHRVGDIYGGEHCCRIAKDFELLGLAVVETPVQKYSVLSVANPTDHKHFPLLRYLIERLNGPFDAWRAEWSKRRQPHDRFRGVGRNAPCPCESGKKYKHCCLKEAGVMRPHCEFTFAVAPPKELQTSVYLD